MRTAQSSRRERKTIAQSPLNKWVVLLLATQIVQLTLRAQDKPELAKFVHIGPAKSDLFLDCVKGVYGKPVLVDESLDFEVSLAPCPSSVDALSTALQSKGIRLFFAGEFIFLIPSKYFPPRPPDLSPYQKTLRWNKINISFSLRPSPDIPVALSEEIGRQVLAHARLIPLEIARASASIEDVNVKIHLWIVVGNVAPNGATPVIAWINGLGSSEEMATSDTGRLVYGEVRGTAYTMFWDSPLFNSNGQVYFKDVNHDGWLEIVIKSSEYCVNQCPEEIVIFDKDGRELTRQKKCDTSPYSYDQEDGVCAIRGKQIDVNDAIMLSSGEPGLAEIDVTGWDGDGRNHVFKLVNRTYMPGPPLIPARRK